MCLHEKTKQNKTYEAERRTFRAELRRLFSKNARILSHSLLVSVCKLQCLKHDNKASNPRHRILVEQSLGNFSTQLRYVGVNEGLLMEY